MAKSSSSGIDFGGILFCVFLILKLTGVIDWSWWWVTAPLWITTLLLIIIGVATWLYYKWFDK